jgi:hypothetical protein
MLNQRIITAARQGQFPLDVMAQITGVPARLIAASVKPSRHGNDLYSLKRVVLFFESESGQRLLRKLHQNQLEIYRDCHATWRDEFGTPRLAENCLVEVRGKRLEITLNNGHRVIQRADNPATGFNGTKIE